MGTVTPIRPLKQGSYDTSTWAPKFDVTIELKDNKDKYSVPKGVGEGTNVSVRFFPHFCKTSVDRLRARVDSDHKPGSHPTISACVAFGLEVIREYDGIQTLLRYKEKFDLIESDVSGDAQAIVADWFKGFKTEIPFAGSRQNVNLPTWIHSSLFALASDIGISVQSMMVLTMMMTLVIQPATNHDDKKEMEQYIEKFFRRVDLRCDGTDALVRAFNLKSDRDER
jgi:hypothetical protein